MSLSSVTDNQIVVQEKWPLSKEYLADLKEVFMLFDKDEDGVITFSELEVVMKCLGQRPSGWHEGAKGMY